MDQLLELEIVGLSPSCVVFTVLQMLYDSLLTNQNTLEYIKSFSKKAKVTQLGTSLNKKKG